MNNLISNAKGNNFQWKNRDPVYLKEQIQDAYNHFNDQLVNLKQEDNPLIFYGELLTQMDSCVTVISHLNNLLPGYNDLEIFAKDLYTKLEVAVHTNQQLKEQILSYEPKEDKFIRYKSLIEKEFRTHPEELIKEFQKVSANFADNIKTDVKQKKLELDFKPEYLQGLDNDFASRIQQNGKIVLDSTNSASMNVMTYAQSDELREKYWRFQQDRCEENVPLVEESLKLKQKIAEFYGMNNIGEYNLKDRMVGTTKNLEEFLVKLHDAVAPAYIKEKQTLEAETKTEVKPWNLNFLLDGLKTKETKFDMREFRPYFEYGAVLQRVWKFLEEKYSVKIEFVEKPENVWHDDVSLLIVTGENIPETKVYIDLIERDDKRQGAYFSPISERVFVVVCNFAPRQTPYLLEFDNINTLFHEFGHCFHQVMFRDQYYFLSGMNVPWDFVEVPSQLFENFMYDPPTLKRIALHHETNTPVPDELIGKLVKRKRFMNAHFMMRQLEFGWLDYNLHTKQDWQTYEAKENFSRVDMYLLDLLKTYRHDYGFPMKTIYRHFNHIFSSLQGYTCGYYSYFYADVIQAHLFHEIQKGLPFQKYVTDILSVGNTRSPLQSVELFCGGFGFDAFLYDYGLVE